MSPEQQRIVIAEWCGAIWYRHPISRSDNGVYKFLAWPGVQEYEGQTEQWKAKSDGTEKMCSMDYMAREFHIPDYLNDLNAMHEADPHGTCAKQLTIMLGVNKWTDSSMIAERVLRATADQRAEALLKTIGKWTEQ